MDRVQKAAEVYLSCDIKMEFFTFRGSDRVRIKFIDLTLNRSINLCCDEVYKLIQQVVFLEAVDTNHPNSMNEISCKAFIVKRYHSAKYLVVTKFLEKITFDKQCITTLLEMKPEFQQFVQSIVSEPFFEL